MAYGLRIAEATALPVGDATAPNGSEMGALMGRVKGNKARTLPINSEAYGASSSYVSGVSGRTDGAVFRVLNGCGPIGTRAIQTRFNKLVRRKRNFGPLNNPSKTCIFCYNLSHTVRGRPVHFLQQINAKMHQRDQ